MLEARFTIRGKTWRLFRDGRLRKLWGYCDHAKRFIKVSRRAKKEIELDTIIHESTHAYFHDIREESVQEFATELAALLWKLGYRRKTDGSN